MLCWGYFEKRRYLLLFCGVGSRFAGNAAEDEGVGRAAAIHPEGAVEVAGDLAGGIEPGDGRTLGVHHLRVLIDENAAHEVVGTGTKAVAVEFPGEGIQVVGTAELAVSALAAVGVPLLNGSGEGVLGQAQVGGQFGGVSPETT